MFRVATGLLVVLFGLSSFAPAMEDTVELDVRTIPIANWIGAGNTTEIPWKLDVRPPLLRMDQRMEVAYTGTLSGKQLKQSGAEHDLYLISRISDSDGEWLTPFSIARQHLEQELPNEGEIRFNMRVLVKPGDYVLWLVLYDKTTGRHNMIKRRMQVDEIGNDPLPYAFMSLPLAEYPRVVQIEDTTFEEVVSLLNLPVRNKHPLDVHVISTLSPPEQWTTRARIVKRHEDNLSGALDAFSQIQLEEGTMSMTGLDLLRREIVFQQKNLHQLNWLELREGFDKAGSSAISADALSGAKANGAFFRDFLDRQLETPASSTDPLRVFVVVTSSLLFESGADLKPLQVDSDCHCRIYHVRFRLSPNDVFDQLQDLMKPLRPRTFNVTSARDLRKAVADIIQELEKL